MTHLPHGMKELRYAELSEPGMKSCQDCERRSTISNGVGSVKCCEGIITGAVFHNQGCSLISCIRNKSRILYVTPGSELGFQLTESDNPVVDKDKDDSSLSLSLQPGDYMKINSGVYRVIKETTNETVSFIHIDQAISRTKEVVYDSKKFFEDMAYFGITKKDGSIFEYGFEFEDANTRAVIKYKGVEEGNEIPTYEIFSGMKRFKTAETNEYVLFLVSHRHWIPIF